jgi:hypothetical protein
MTLKQLQKSNGIPRNQYLEPNGKNLLGSQAGSWGRGWQERKQGIEKKRESNLLGSPGPFCLGAQNLV